jgi:hypothetical protein
MANAGRTQQQKKKVNIETYESISSDDARKGQNMF